MSLFSGLADLARQARAAPADFWRTVWDTDEEYNTPEMLGNMAQGVGRTAGGLVELLKEVGSAGPALHQQLGRAAQIGAGMPSAVVEDVKRRYSGDIAGQMYEDPASYLFDAADVVGLGGGVAKGARAGGRALSDFANKPIPGGRPFSDLAAGEAGMLQGPGGRRFARFGEKTGEGWMADLDDFAVHEASHADQFVDPVETQLGAGFADPSSPWFPHYSSEGPTALDTALELRYNKRGLSDDRVLERMGRYGDLESPADEIPLGSKFYASTEGEAPGSPYHSEYVNLDPRAVDPMGRHVPESGYTPEEAYTRKHWLREFLGGGESEAGAVRFGRGYDPEAPGERYATTSPREDAILDDLNALDDLLEQARQSPDVDPADLAELEKHRAQLGRSLTNIGQRHTPKVLPDESMVSGESGTPKPWPTLKTPEMTPREAKRDWKSWAEFGSPRYAPQDPMAQLEARLRSMEISGNLAKSEHGLVHGRDYPGDVEKAGGRLVRAEDKRLRQEELAPLFKRQDALYKRRDYLAAAVEDIRARAQSEGIDPAELRTAHQKLDEIEHIKTELRDIRAEVPWNTRKGEEDVLLKNPGHTSDVGDLVGGEGEEAAGKFGRGRRTPLLRTSDPQADVDATYAQALKRKKQKEIDDEAALAADMQGSAKDLTGYKHDVAVEGKRARRARQLRREDTHKPRRRREEAVQRATQNEPTAPAGDLDTALDLARERAGKQAVSARQIAEAAGMKNPDLDEIRAWMQEQKDAGTYYGRGKTKAKKAEQPAASADDSMEVDYDIAADALRAVGKSEERIVELLGERPSALADEAASTTTPPAREKGTGQQGRRRGSTSLPPNKTLTNARKTLRAKNKQNPTAKEIVDHLGLDEKLVKEVRQWLKKQPRVVAV